MYESAQKTRSGRTSGGDEVSSWKLNHYIVTFSMFVDMWNNIALLFQFDIKVILKVFCK